MKRYTNGDKEIMATNKLYNLIYKAQGFRPIEEWDDAELGEKDLKEKSLEELKALCDERGLEYKAKSKKNDLIQLLKSME